MSMKSSSGRTFILSCFILIFFLLALVSINEVRVESFFNFGRCALPNNYFGIEIFSSNQSLETNSSSPLSSSSFLNASSSSSFNDSSSSLWDEDDFRLLIGILTRAQNYDRRNFLRLVYGTQSIEGAQVDVKFVFCNLTKEDEEILVALEIMRYNDIIIMDCQENMDNGKTYTYFSSLPEMLSNSDRPDPPYHYVMKADDDTYIRVNDLIRSLRPLPRSDLYYGFVFPCKSLDPHGLYMSGMGYLISWDIVEWIRVSEIPKNHQAGPEDRNVGEWLRDGGKAKNRFTGKWSMYDFPHPRSACTHALWPNTIAVHKLKNQAKWIETLTYFNVTSNLKPSRLYHIPK